MLENCATIDSCEALLSEQVHLFGLLGQIPFTNNDFEMLCTFVSKEFSFSTNGEFESEIVNYPATLSCYLVLRGIFNYSEGAYWKSIHDDIKEFNTAKSQLLGKAFLRFIERNKLFYVEIPKSLKYVTPILMHGIIPQEQVQEYFDKVIYPLVTRELICPTDTIEIADWLNENRTLQKNEERVRVLSKDLETQLAEFPDTNSESEDPETVAAEIDALDRQITLLSNELQTLDTSNDQFEKYQTIKRDIAEAKILETDLTLLEQKKEDLSDRIQTLSQLHEQNLFNTVFPGEIPDPDSAAMYAECELIDYMSSVAKTGSPEEKEKLIEFIHSLSEGITNNSIQLSNTAMEKYQTLLSFTMSNLPEADDYEISDIPAAHVNSTSVLSNRESYQSELAFSHSDTPEIPLAGAFHDIQSLYEIEETVSDIGVETETTADETVSDIEVETETTAEETVSDIEVETETTAEETVSDIEVETETTADETVSDIEVETETTADETLPSETFSSSDVQIETHPQAESDIPINASPEPDNLNSSTGMEATVTSNADAPSGDAVICTPNSSNNKRDFGKIAQSLRIQMLNEQTIKNEQNRSGLNLADNSQAKTPHAPEEVTPQTESELVTLQIDDTPDEFATKSEFGIIPSESTDVREMAAEQKINLFDLAGIENETPDKILSDTRKSTGSVNVPAKDSVLPNPQRKVMSLADDPKVPKKYKKKSFISRLIAILFRR